MKYSKEFKLEAVKYKEETISEAARKREIPKQTLSRWVKQYKHYGKEGLHNKKKGAKEKPINPELEKKVLRLWVKKKRSAYKMLRDLSRKGSGNNRNKNEYISKREIYKIYKKYSLNNDKNNRYNFLCF